MVPLLQFFFVCASVVSYEAFVLSLFNPHLSFWCLGMAVFRDFSRTFSVLFEKIVTRYKMIGYYMGILRQTACMLINSIMVDNI